MGKRQRQRGRRKVRIDWEEFEVGGGRSGVLIPYSFILDIIFVPQTGHSRLAGRGGSCPGARGSVAGAKDPGWNFLHFWHHHSNFNIVRSPSGQASASDSWCPRKWSTARGTPIRIDQPHRRITGGTVHVRRSTGLRVGDHEGLAVRTTRVADANIN
jgi:hypothetical protein